jgi:hypothetical protein
MSDYKFYFSDDCKYCQELAKLMSKKNLLHKFSIINVDNDFVPEFITSVPTIIVPYLKPLEGGKAFKWISGCEEHFIKNKYLTYASKANINRLFTFKEIADKMNLS